MKKNGAVPAMLFPAPEEGWIYPGPPERIVYRTLAEAAEKLPAGKTIHLAIPCQALVIEGLRLPATERAELAGMVRLQLVKNLPYPLSEASTDFVVVETTDMESSVVSLSASHESLNNLCQPLRARSQLPERITPYVLHVAAACPPAESVLAIYPEQGNLVLTICVDRKLFWAHMIPSTDPARIAAELPQALLAATMEGAPTDFNRVLLAPEAQELAPVLRAVVTAPVETLPPVAPALATPLNLVPDTWRSAAQQQVRAKKTRRRLIFAAVLYVAAFVAGTAYRFYLGREESRLRAQTAAAQPTLQRIQERQARSNALAPAFDPSRTTVEILFLVQRALPNESTQITEFDDQPDQWHIVGEAPSHSLAIDYLNRLKADPELKAYDITATPPQLLVNEHAQFNIFGKR